MLVEMLSYHDKDKWVTVGILTFEECLNLLSQEYVCAVAVQDAVFAWKDYAGRQGVSNNNVWTWVSNYPDLVIELAKGWKSLC